jgi:uncharacterized metal-binding protein
MWLMASLYFGIPVKYVLGGIVGLLIAVVFSMDEDQAEGHKDVTIIDRFFNRYGVLYKHRSISHWPVIGTLTRLVYIPTEIGAFFGRIVAWAFVVWAAIEYHDKIPWGVLGVGLLVWIWRDISHTVLDIVVSAYKRNWAVMTAGAVVFVGMAFFIAVILLR